MDASKRPMLDAEPHRDRGILRFPPHQINFIMRFKAAYILIGIALIVMAFQMPAEKNVGIVLGFSLFALGVYCGALRNWRTEPGIWMLALLAFAINGPMFVWCLYLWWAPAQGAVPIFQGPGRVFEASLSLVLFGVLTRLLYSVCRENWERTRPKPKNVWRDNIDIQQSDRQPPA